MPAALRGPVAKGNPLGLRHPAITPMPAELRAGGAVAPSRDLLCKLDSSDDDLWRVLAP